MERLSEYWFIDSNYEYTLVAHKCKDVGSVVDDERWELGNYFETEDQCNNLIRSIYADCEPISFDDCDCDCSLSDNYGGNY